MPFFQSLVSLLCLLERLKERHSDSVYCVNGAIVIFETRPSNILFVSTSLRSLQRLYLKGPVFVSYICWTAPLNIDAVSLPRLQSILPLPRFPFLLNTRGQEGRID
jgi:hypothetical protein